MTTFIEDFHRVDGEYIRVAAEQASRFAKGVADDFNPIHDPDAPRFCVPGDLLFALVLSRYGLSQRMQFSFTGMVGNELGLIFPDTQDAAFKIVGEAGKTYLEVEREGDVSTNETQIESLIRKYVAFSGHNFPDILVPLMAEQDVMINPVRPLVVYESMSFDLNHVNFDEVDLTLVEQTLVVTDKRGDAELGFHFTANGEVVGTGSKKLVLGGLRAYEQEAIDDMCRRYEERKVTLS